MRRAWRGLFLCIAASWCLSAFQGGQVFALRVPGSSMEPTIIQGQMIIVAATDPADPSAVGVGDIVVVEVESLDHARLIKRVVGVGGDTVEIRDKQLFRNGEPLVEPYVQFLDDRIYVAGDDPASVQRDQLVRLVIPVDEMFVLGDNRDRSHDSRYFGSLGLRSVVGKVQ